jgi:hypothetical protein
MLNSLGAGDLIDAVGSEFDWEMVIRFPNYLRRRRGTLQ